MYMASTIKPIMANIFDDTLTLKTFFKRWEFWTLVAYSSLFSLIFNEDSCSASTGLFVIQNQKPNHFFNVEYGKIRKFLLKKQTIIQRWEPFVHPSKLVVLRPQQVQYCWWLCNCWYWVALLFETIAAVEFGSREAGNPRWWIQIELKVFLSLQTLKLKNGKFLDFFLNSQVGIF